MTLPPLYRLTDTLIAVMGDLVENDGELTPELEAAIAQAEGSFDEKAERVAQAVRHLTVTAAAAREEADRLTAISRARSRSADRLKAYLLGEMLRAQKVTVETTTVRLRVVQNPRPSISWTLAAEAIPEAFRRVTFALNGDAAWEAWKSRGVLPEGFCVEQGQHLRIK